MASETTTVLGRRAEDRALAYLEAQGLVLLERNYRCRGGELDLVMLDGPTLVLVEVRSRSGNRYGGAAASVDGRKQRRFVLAARHLLRCRPAYRSRPARFDVVAIDGGDAAGEPRLDWIRAAFSAA